MGTEIDKVSSMAQTHVMAIGSNHMSVRILKAINWYRKTSRHVARRQIADLRKF